MEAPSIMSKEFTVPSVVFPSGVNPSGLRHRRPNPSFQPQTAAVGSPAINSTTMIDDEPPLLEELGINTSQIWSKTTSILNPIRTNPKNNLHENADLSGPFILLMAFGLFQLLAGKFHFGIMLGWLLMAAGFLYFVFNMLAGRNGNLDLYKCVSLIGYCMLPMVILSVLSLFVPQGGLAILVMAVIFVTWSSRICSRLLVEVGRWDEHSGLVAYACFLIFSLFSLLVIF